MKVLWLSHILPYPPAGRGVLQRSHHLLRQACRRHGVHLLAFDRVVVEGHEGSEGAVEALRRFCERVETVPVGLTRGSPGWWRLVVTSLFRSAPYDVRWLSSAGFEHRVRRIVDRHGPFDLVHVDTVGLMPYAEFVDAPVVLNHHNVESDMMERRAGHASNPLARMYLLRESRKLAAYERRVCPEASVNVTVSNLDGSRLRDRVGRELDVVTVSNGVDVEYFRPRERANRQEGNLVFAGGMNWYPNRDAVLHFWRNVWPDLLERDPALTLTLVGSDPPAELVRAAEEDTRLETPGFVDDVRVYLDRASIYVCPIRDGGGTRLKILDALAMEKALVATAFSVEGLGLLEDVHYVKAETPEEWVRQILRLRCDASLRERLGKEGRRLVVERYSWETIGRDLERAYRLAAGSDRSGVGGAAGL